MKINNDEKIKYEEIHGKGTVRNIFGDQGNMERNFWELGNSVKGNFGGKLNLVLRNNGTTVNFHREQGNMHPPLGGPQFNGTLRKEKTYLQKIIKASARQN